MYAPCREAAEEMVCTRISASYDTGAGFSVAMRGTSPAASNERRRVRQLQDGAAARQHQRTPEPPQR